MQVTVKINEIEVTINRPELSDPNRDVWGEEDTIQYHANEMLKIASDKALELLKQTKCNK